MSHDSFESVQTCGRGPCVLKKKDPTIAVLVN